MSYYDNDESKLIIYAIKIITDSYGKEKSRKVIFQLEANSSKKDKIIEAVAVANASKS